MTRRSFLTTLVLTFALASGVANLVHVLDSGRIATLLIIAFAGVVLGLIVAVQLASALNEDAHGFHLAGWVDHLFGLEMRAPRRPRKKKRRSTPGPETPVLVGVGGTGQAAAVAAVTLVLAVSVTAPAAQVTEFGASAAGSGDVAEPHDSQTSAAGPTIPFPPAPAPDSVSSR